MRCPVQPPQKLQRARDIDKIPHTKRLAFSFLALDEIHRHLDIRPRQTQALHQHFRLEAVAARFDGQAFQYRCLVDLQAVVIPQPAQGKPVSILKGQKDCSFSNDFPSEKIMIKNGIISVKKAPIIP